jgi:DNA-binding XRE family transcriptional regulator
MAKVRLQSEAEREKALLLPLGKAELKAWRQRLGWTQAEAAAWLGVAKRSYENWECGHRNPGHPMGIRLRMEMASRRSK